MHSLVISITVLSIVYVFDKILVIVLVMTFLPHHLIGPNVSVFHIPSLPDKKKSKSKFHTITACINKFTLNPYFYVHKKRRVNWRILIIQEILQHPRDIAIQSSTFWMTCAVILGRRIFARNLLKFYLRNEYHFNFYIHRYCLLQLLQKHHFVLLSFEANSPTPS